MTYVCWNIHQRGRYDEVNVTAICNEQGYWEPSTDDICTESTGERYVANLHFPMACISIGSLLSEDGKIAVASSLIMTTFIISSIVFFISVIIIVKNRLSLLQ